MEAKSFFNLVPDFERKEKRTSTLHIKGDVTGLSWINSDALLTCSSKGGLNLYKLEQYR